MSQAATATIVSGPEAGPGFQVDDIYRTDCIEGLHAIRPNSIPLVLTDIPYNELNKRAKPQKKGKDSPGPKEWGAWSRGYNLFKGDADTLSFDLHVFCYLVSRVSSGTAIIFCGTEQVSTIRKAFVQFGYTTRLLVWEKTNPSPFHGQRFFLSGIETAVFARKTGAAYNGFCRNTVFRFARARSDIHPTQKPVPLMRELIRLCSEPGDVVLDPCIGSGTTAEAALLEGRHYLGFDKNRSYVSAAKKRLSKVQLPLPENNPTPNGDPTS